MDNENNYYSLIEDLVKKHRKFPGYEAILDDIVKDVYAHSEVILNSIDNESVIESYLEKVISTSIITVPKRMKFNNEVKHRVISKEPSLNIQKVVPPLVEDKKDAPVITEDTLQADVQNENLINEEVLSSEGEELELQEDLVLNDNPEQELEEVALDENGASSDIMSFSQNIGVEKADPNLVDKMINSIGNDEITETLDNSAEPDAEISEDDLSVVDDLKVFNEDSELEELELESDGLEAEPENNAVTESEFVNADEEIILDTEEDTENIELNEEELLPAADEHVDYLDAVEEKPEELDLLNEGAADVNLSEAETENHDESELPEEDNQQLIFDESDTNSDDVLQLEFEEREDVQVDNDIQPEDSSTDELGFVELNPVSESIEPVSDMLPEEIPTDVLPEPILEEDDISESPLAENIDTDNGLLDIESSGDNEIMDLPSEYDLADGDAGEVLKPTEELVTVDDDVLSFEESDNTLIESEEFALNIDSEDEYDAELQVEDKYNSEVAEDESKYDNTEYMESDEDDIPSSLSANTLPQEEHHYVPADYSVFDYTPNDSLPSIDANSVTAKLMQLNQDYPDLNVLQIFEMKYKQNITISEIAERLSTDKNQVIMVLNKIIELV